MRIELHCHSHRSDGTDPPRVVADRAASSGVVIFCLTDHDTFVGYPDTLETAGSMHVLRGMELSCAERGRTVHLLAYGLAEGPGLDELGRILERLRTARRTRVAEICARFARWNIHLSPEAILQKAAGATPGRPHVAAALVEAGVVRSVREAFDRFLKDGGPADVPAERLTVEDGVAAARAAGGRVSLAHPHTVGAPEKVAALLARARPLGLEGIEACYGLYSRRQQKPWLEMAAALGLVVTGGSDYHGVAVLPEVPAPGLDLPAPHSDRLRAWLEV